MSASRVLLLVAGACLLLGLVFGFSPVRADGYDCGNGFAESSDLLADELSDTMMGGTGENGCDAARASRTPIVWGALGVGGLLGLVGVSMARNESQTRKTVF